MKVKYGWHPEYKDPNHWDTRTPLWKGMPRLFNLYLNLNDNKIRRFLRKQRGRILDAGCGTGRFLSYADVGADFSKGMIQRGKKSKRSLVRSSILHLPFKDKAFDVAFTVDVLLHIEIEKRDDAIKELQRVAKRVYNFLLEHRSVIPWVMQTLIALSCFVNRFRPYIVLLLAFPMDRLRKLQVEEANYKPEVTLLS